MVSWAQPWAAPLSPPLPCVVLQQWQPRLKLLSAREMRVRMRCFKMFFPGCAGGRDGAGGRRASAVAAPEH